MGIKREEWQLVAHHEHKHTVPPHPRDPSDNCRDVLLQLATLGVEVLAMVGHHTT